MIDPISCVTLAAGAFKTLKSAVAAGRDLQDCTSQLASWGRAMSDFNNAEERQKNPPFWQKTFKGSDQETALELYAQKKKMEFLRSEMKEFIVWNYGKSGYEELLQIEAQMRKKQRAEVYRKQQQIDAIINFAIGAVIFAIGAGIIFFIFYIWGSRQGRW